MKVDGHLKIVGSISNNVRQGEEYVFQNFRLDFIELYCPIYKIQKIHTFINDEILCMFRIVKAGAEKADEAPSILKKQRITTGLQHHHNIAIEILLNH